MTVFKGVRRLKWATGECDRECPMCSYSGLSYDGFKSVLYWRAQITGSRTLRVGANCLVPSGNTVVCGLLRAAEFGEVNSLRAATSIPQPSYDRLRTGSCLLPRTLHRGKRNGAYVDRRPPSFDAAVLVAQLNPPQASYGGSKLWITGSRSKDYSKSDMVQI